MTEYVDDDTRIRRPLGGYLIYVWVGGPLLALALLLVLTFFRPGRDDDVIGPKGDSRRGPQEVPLAAVRDALARQTDLPSCRAAVSQANTHLQKSRPEDRPGPLPQGQTERLKSALSFDEGDVAELNATTFTTLDASHLETCFILRDAARSLEVAAPAGRDRKPVKPTPIESARMAFEWVCRQVRLEASIDPLPAPPGFVLRRGSGTPLERAVVFVALLEQFGLSQGGTGLQGCLLFLPVRKKLEFWACGVVAANEPETIYLFDPRLGLPLPGPKGQGIATLKQAREDPEVLGQLKVGDVAYYVTAAKAKDAEAATYAPLSALAPRMRLLQDRLLRDPVWRDSDGNNHPLPPAIRVKLAEDDPGAIDSVRKAFVASGGKADSVTYWRDGGKILRSFVGRADGGIDVTIRFAVRDFKGFSLDDDPAVYPIPRRALLEMASVPWEDFPVVFRDPERFRFDKGPGAGIRGFFGAPFLRWLREPNSARELIVRGQFDRAAPELSKERAYWHQARQRALTLDQVRQGPAAWEEKVREGVGAWLQQAFAVYAELPPSAPGQPPPASPEVAKLYHWRPGDPMDVLMSGAMADARAAQVTYQLGLCKHEESVRSQAQLDLARRAGLEAAEDEQEVRRMWQQTAEWWRQYLANHGKRPGAAAARRLLGEARLGHKQPAEAVKLWQAGAELTDDNVAKLGLLWQAKQVK